MDWEQPELELEEEEDHRHRRHSGSAVGGAFCSVKAGHQSLPQHLAEEEEVKLEELGSSGKDPFGRLGASVVADEVVEDHEAVLVDDQVEEEAGLHPHRLQ